MWACCQHGVADACFCWSCAFWGTPLNLLCICCVSAVHLLSVLLSVVHLLPVVHLLSECICCARLQPNPSKLCIEGTAKHCIIVSKAQHDGGRQADLGQRPNKRQSRRWPNRTLRKQGQSKMTKFQALSFNFCYLALPLLSQCAFNTPSALPFA